MSLGKSLGRPTHGFTSSRLAAENGKGDTLTCFANHAVFDWHENIPSPSVMNRTDRRELIRILADQSYMHPVTMLAVILIKKREARLPEHRKRHPNYR